MTVSDIIVELMLDKIERLERDVQQLSATIAELNGRLDKARATQPKPDAKREQRRLRSLEYSRKYKKVDGCPKGYIVPDHLRERYGLGPRPKED